MKLRMRRLARITRDQILNYWRHGYRYIPTNLCIETTTRCNAKCVYCARFKTEMEIGDMPFDFFKSLVSAASPFTTDYVMPYSRGEPLMYPHIIEGIQFITDCGNKSLMYSNGALMSEKMARGIIEAGLDVISFSIDDNEPEKFETVRGLKWDRVLGNIKRLVEVRNEIESKMEIRVRSCVGPFNIDRIRDIKIFWEEIVDEVRMMPLLPMPNRAAMEHQPIYMLPPHECGQPYLALNVRLDGKIVFCCNDWHDQLEITKLDMKKKVTKRQLLDIYNGKMFGRMRNDLEFGKGAPLLCAYCQSDRRADRMWKELRACGIERGKTTDIEA